MIPARVGSERLQHKNLLSYNNQTLIEHSLQLALESNCFDSVYLNGDSEIFKPFAISKNASFHLRPKALGTSDTPIDAVINEFLIQHNFTSRLFLINPPSQLLSHNDVNRFFREFIDQDSDSMIATTVLARHAQINGVPINFNPREPLSRTQDLVPIEVFNYSIMAWKADVFKETYKSTGAGLMCGNFKTFENGARNFLAIKDSEDFEMVRLLKESGKFDD